MRRINITGNAGVGKSTLAAQIGRILDLPVFGLDEVVWKPGWRKADPDERFVEEQALCEGPSWVIDGVSRTIRDAADTIVFLDYPRRVSFWRCARRNWRYLFRSRPGLPDNCPEIRIVAALIRMIWRFPRTVRPALLAEFDQWRERKILVHIGSSAELRVFLAGLEQTAARTAMLSGFRVAAEEGPPTSFRLADVHDAETRRGR